MKCVYEDLEKKNLQQTPTKTKTNLSPQTRGDKRSKEEQARIMNDIFSLSSKHNDYEIMQLLQLPNSTYYNYKQKLYEECKNIWREMCKETQAYRAIQLKNSLVLCIKINEEIALDPNQPAKDRIDASKEMCETGLKLFILTRDGPQAVLDMHKEGK